MGADEEKVKAYIAQMSFKQKVQYIFDEYKFHILAVIIATVCLVSFVWDLATRDTPVLWGMVVNQPTFDTEAFAEGSKDAMALEGRECVSVVDGLVLYADEVNNSSTLSYSCMNQIVCTAAVKELDFIFTDTEGLELLYGMGMFTGVEEVLTEALRDAYADCLYTPEGAVVPVALDLTGTSIAENLKLTDGEVYLILPNLSGNTELLQQLLLYLSRL